MVKSWCKLTNMAPIYGQASVNSDDSNVSLYLYANFQQLKCLIIKLIQICPIEGLLTKVIEECLTLCLAKLLK